MYSDADKFEINKRSSSGGFEANMFVMNTSGDVGIGTISPSAKLEVNGTILTSTVDIGNHSTFGLIGHRDLNNYSNGSYALLIHNQGDVYLNAYGTAGNKMRFRINGNDKMFLNHNGFLGINTSPSVHLHVNGAARATSFTTTSDDRVKHNETDISNSLAIISQLNPKRYLKTNEMYDSSFNIATDDLKEGDSISEEYGVIAQDLLGIDDLSFLVKQSIDASGNEIAPMALDYQSLFVLAIKGIQELQARIETLEAMI